LWQQGWRVLEIFLWQRWQLGPQQDVAKVKSTTKGGKNRIVVKKGMGMGMV